MGLKIETNNKGEYKLTDTGIDKRIHSKKWISKEEAKEILMGNALMDFVQRALKIDVDFPNGYMIDGRMTSPGAKHLEILTENYSNEFYQNEFNRLAEKYKMNEILIT